MYTHTRIASNHRSTTFSEHTNTRTHTHTHVNTCICTQYMYTHKNVAFHLQQRHLVYGKCFTTLTQTVSNTTTHTHTLQRTPKRTLRHALQSTLQHTLQHTLQQSPQRHLFLVERTRRLVQRFLCLLLRARELKCARHLCVAHTNASCHTSKCVILHIRMHNDAHVNASCQTYECVKAHVQMCHVTRMLLSWHKSK